ncbi:MAG: DUF5615 family PIN-like protein [Salinivirgaceae bacterium]|jgi:predicted nuclease of predicted toxin-antitoxin system|nr:DUF5615 family PIN-like protein [Salinivirgaceae bacterium]
MKLLFDQNISFSISKKLQNNFPSCLHVSECGLKDCEDSEIWLFAKENNLTIVTFDADFYDMSLINGHPPKIVWIRTGNLITPELVKLLVQNETRINEFLHSTEFEEIACIEIDW